MRIAQRLNWYDNFDSVTERGVALQYVTRLWEPIFAAILREPDLLETKRGDFEANRNRKKDVGPAPDPPEDWNELSTELTLGEHLKGGIGNLNEYLQVVDSMEAKPPGVDIEYLRERLGEYCAVAIDDAQEFERLYGLGGVVNAANQRARALKLQLEVGEPYLVFDPEDHQAQPTLVLVYYATPDLPSAKLIEAEREIYGVVTKDGRSLVAIRIRRKEG